MLATNNTGNRLQCTRFLVKYNKYNIELGMQRITQSSNHLDKPCLTIFQHFKCNFKWTVTQVMQRYSCFRFYKSCLMSTQHFIQHANYLFHLSPCLHLRHNDTNVITAGIKASVIIWSLYLLNENAACLIGVVVHK